MAKKANGQTADAVLAAAKETGLEISRVGNVVAWAGKDGGKNKPKGPLAGKKIVPASSGTFPTTGALWVGLLTGVILIVGGLTFFPALSLGPIAEHFAMFAGKQF